MVDNGTPLFFWALVVLVLGGLIFWIGHRLRKSQADLEAGRAHPMYSWSTSDSYCFYLCCWKWAARALGGILVALFFLFSFLSVSSVQSTGVALENQLNSQYVQNENVLSNYINGFYEQLGVANLQSQKINKILIGAVASQFNLRAWAADPKKNPLFAALGEAYPQVTLSQYQQMITYIANGRQQFQQAQQQLLTDLQELDTYEQSGVIVHPLMVRLAGIPNANLHVTIGGVTYTGGAAESRMWGIVRNATAEQQFASGVGTPLSPSAK